MRPWLLLLVVPSATAHSAEYTGSVNKVVDGDTFWLCDDNGCYKFRVCGIDTPEKGEPGYAESKTALATIVKGKPVRCVLVGGGTPCDGKSSLPVATDLSLNASRRPVTSQGQWWSKVLPASTLSSQEATTPKGETATLARRTCRRAHSFRLMWPY